MSESVGINNRRRFPRFKVEGELFVFHLDLGKIQEIGVGGVRFTYTEKVCLQGDYPEKGVLFTENNDLLVELPFKTVSDTSLEHLTSDHVKSRQRIIIFDDLAEDQLDQLEKFILGNVDIPAMEDSVIMDELAYWD